MNRKGIVRTATLAGVAAAIGLTATLTATAAPRPVTATADLDGNGEIETVTATMAGDHEQVISATVNGVATSIRVQADSQFGLQAPRVADLNGDGSQELIVPTSVGANTTQFTALHYHDGLQQVVGADGKPLELAEGGGVAAKLGYNCSDTEGGGRVFGTVAAEADDLNAPNLTYSGTRTVYTMRDGALTVQETVPFSHRPDTNPLVVADPATCS
ncbi:VCBS repeat-containing protein [Amycolatopsis sp. CA-230715]|uniref:VCBS repeat-containing protein n=1 Tax=Amycolatopsis sp. CA-230715 TaxID=2745196 RepID=UPI001C01F670|nr:VCBS repeat-containing protein [Amycolatopsis sp. CA-230715]QWF81179.1 hypothetical protein HUW46_04605 [Amycolatopsis sp. CA-230715]